jgi:HAE1 family hydrophobic/amphiphilic exporter-1
VTRLTRLALRNRAIVALAAIAVVVAGVFAVRSLRQELIPDLKFPLLTVVTLQPGAAPGDVERGITTPIETALKGSPALEELSSYSNEGMSIIIAQYQFGTDMAETKAEVQDAVQRVAAAFPQGVQAPIVEELNFQDFPVVQLAVIPEDGGDTRAFTRTLTNDVVPLLQQVDGVADVALTGTSSDELRVQLRPEAVVASGVSPQAVLAALQSANLSSAAGTLESGTLAYPVTVAAATVTVDAYRELSIPLSTASTGPAETTAAGTRVPATTLGELADVSVASAPVTAITRTDGQPSAGIAITKSREGNTVEVSRAVRDLFPQIEAALGGTATLVVVFDQADYIEDSIDSMANEGVIGAVFAVLVIFVFLRSWRSTVVAGISIPLSVLGALIILWGRGESLNTITLGGLTIAIGRVIDDSIVVLENTYRHLQEGDDIGSAALSGTREVAGAITASTLTTVAVFLPLGFVEGFSAEYFRPFGWTVTVALLASLLVAVTVVPVAATWLLSKRHVGHREADELTGLQRAYLPVLGLALRHKAITIVLAVGLFVAVMPLGALLDQNLFDSSGENSMSLTQQMAPGTNLDSTSAAAEDVEEILSATEGVEHYQVTVGSSGTLFGPGGGTSASSSQAQYTVQTDPEMRKPDIVADVRAALDGVQGIGTVVVSGESGTFGSNSTIEVRVQADDPALLREASEQVKLRVESVDGVTNVTSTVSERRPQYLIDVDQQKAAAAGVDPAAIAPIVGLVVSGLPAGFAPTTEGPLPLRITLPALLAASPEVLPQIPVPTANGGSVPLTAVAEVRQVEAPAQITHVDGERTATVSAQVVSNNITAAAAEVQDALSLLELPEGSSYSLAGAGEETADVQRTLMTAMVIAVLLVYIIMVATFRSLLNPLILLVSIPFAGVGAVGLMYVTGTSLGMPSLIGLLMLVGIVVTNAIVLLDLIEKFRRQGMPAVEAVVEGGRRRLRPILMTAVATILALTPMALGLGESAFLSTPLAVTVIGGLVSSTLLTLVIVPVLYVAVDRLRRRDAAPAATGVGATIDAAAGGDAPVMAG